MKCPSCNGKAITFGQWLTGTRAFRTECMSCGERLRATPSVYLGFVMTVGLALALIPFAGNVLAYFGITDASKKITLLALLPIIVLGWITTWFVGGYSKQKKRMAE